MSGRPLEDIISEGIEINRETDDGRWRLVELAVEVEKAYGRNLIGEFAKGVGLRTQTAREYRRVGAFWLQNAAYAALRESPVLFYSHFRDAVRLKDADAAAAFLEHVADNNLSVEAASVEIRKAMGKPVPPARVMDVEAVIGWDALDSHKGRVMFITDLMFVQRLEAGKLYRVVVTEVE